MGLDLYHAKWSRKDKDANEYFLLDELADFPIILDRHQDLITHVVKMECKFTIYILPDIESKSAYDIEWLEREGNVRFLVVHDGIQEEILHLEMTHHLSGMHQFIHEMSGENEKKVIEYAESYEMIPVIYYKEVGYQRKGMKDGFYEAFENCKPYCKKEDVMRAAMYLREKGAFREDFIDSFIEGDSVFFASW